MENSKMKLAVLVLVVIAVVAGVMFVWAQKELSETKSSLAAQNINDKTLAFTKLFVEKVLKADREIDFETRLALENSVRTLGNEQILAQWQKFTDSKTESDAQKEVKNLLQVLINNISVK